MATRKTRPAPELKVEDEETKEVWHSLASVALVMGRSERQVRRYLEADLLASEIHDGQPRVAESVLLKFMNSRTYPKAPPEKGEDENGFVSQVELAKITMEHAAQAFKNYNGATEGLLRMFQQELERSRLRNADLEKQSNDNNDAIREAQKQNHELEQARQKSELLEKYLDKGFEKVLEPIAGVFAMKAAGFGKRPAAAAAPGPDPGGVTPSQPAAAAGDIASLVQVATLLKEKMGKQELGMLAFLISDWAPDEQERFRSAMLSGLGLVVPSKEEANPNESAAH